MQRRDESDFISLCVTLVVHGVLAWMIIRAYSNQQEFLLHYRKPPLKDRYTYGPGYIVALPDAPAPPPIVKLPPRREELLAQLPPLPEPPVVALPKPPPPPKPKDESDKDSQFGEANSKGEAMNSSKGDEPGVGRQGDQEQAWLSRDPVGPGGLPPVPSRFTGLPGEGGDNRPRRPRGPGGDGAGSPPRAPLAMALMPPPSANPTPFGPSGGGSPPILVAPKFVAPPPTPPPPAPLATTPPAPPKSDIIAITEPEGPVVRPVDPKATTRPTAVAEDLPAGPESTIRPKIKPPTTQPNDTLVEVPLSPKTLKNSPSTRPTQIAVDDKVHPDTARPSPTSQPAELVAANAPSAEKTKPKPTTQPVHEATVDANPTRPNPERIIDDLLKTPPTTLPADAVASAFPSSTQPSNTPGLKPTGQPPIAIAAYMPPVIDPGSEVPPSKPLRPDATHPGPGGSPDSGGGRAGPSIAPADPAPEADRESDAFSPKGTVVIKPGKIDARLGRDVKPVKPRLPLTGELDVFSQLTASIVLRVSIDENGKVTDVKTIKSSGSNAIDHPTELALYQWWIEPAKNKAGNPVKDVIMLTITFR